MIALKRILVPTDFSETSKAAVQYGAAFARAFGAKLFILHAAAPPEFETIVEGERVVESLSETAAAPFQPSREEIVHSAAREQLSLSLGEHEEKELQPEYVLRASGPGGAYIEIVR